jgi:hypothetical protein
MDLATIQNRIYEVNGTRVMLDFDLDTLYEVETRVLNQAIKRNKDRFLDDFMFPLKKEACEEISSSQSVMTSKRPKSALPYAFTEHVVTMLASVLKSDKARKMHIEIVRAFVAVRKTVLNIDTFKLKELKTK